MTRKEGMIQPVPVMLAPRPSARVLLADDDEELRALLAFGLRWHGFEVVEVVDGDELYAHLGACLLEGSPKPDVIVSDLRMPGVSGLEVLGSVRRVKDIPFILMTGGHETRAEVLRSGAAAMLEKPFDLADLLDAVNDSIASSRRKRAD